MDALGVTGDLGADDAGCVSLDFGAADAADAARRGRVEGLGRRRRRGRIVELRFFGGLGIEEVAEVLGIAPITVKREWRIARAWFRRELTEVPLPGPREDP